jgi:heat shock protein HslJ
MLKLISGIAMLFFVGITVSLAGELSINELQGSWKLVEMDGKTVAQPQTATLPKFSITGQAISGFDGCNQFWGQLDQPGSIGKTRMACPDTKLSLPLDFSDPLPQLKAGRIDIGRLVLPAWKSLPGSVYRKE